MDTNEGTAYTFRAGDFGFQDADNNDNDATNDDNLDHVMITSLPGTGQGTLWLDFDGDDQIDGGEAVSVDDEVTKADIDGGKLQYIPLASGTGKAFTSFKFKVSDGLDDSAEYDMFINVSVKFVSNLGQMTNDDDYNITTTTNARAGAFTTGSNPKGYDLGSFKLNLRNFQIDDNATTTVKLYSGNSGKPNTELCILVNPDEQGDEIYTFAAPASCPAMDKGTEYLVVVNTYEAHGYNPDQRLLGSHGLS